MVSLFNLSKMLNFYYVSFIEILDWETILKDLTCLIYYKYVYMCDEQISTGKWIIDDY